MTRCLIKTLAENDVINKSAELGTGLVDGGCGS